MQKASCTQKPSAPLLQKESARVISKGGIATGIHIYTYKEHYVSTLVFKNPLSRAVSIFTSFDWVAYVFGPVVGNGCTGSDPKEEIRKPLGMLR